MNKCRIVQDLMPLYAEELVSEETAEFVREHLAGCESCQMLLNRMRLPLPGEESMVDYRKDLRRDIMKIAGKTLLAVIAVLAVFSYGLWEWGFLDREIYESPDGEIFFEVLDCDSGFFEGGAYIVTSDGRGRNLYGNKSYQDFHVWFAPDSSGYLVWIEFDDHDETYLMTTEYNEIMDYYTSSYYPSFEIEERDFLELIKKSVWAAIEENSMESEIVPDASETDYESLDVQFQRWSQDGNLIWFDFRTDGVFSGQAAFNCDKKAVETVEVVWSRKIIIGS